RTSGTAWDANGVTAAVPEMPPTVMVEPAHPTGKRAGSMLVRLTRVLVPSVRASPTAGKPARLGFSPAVRVSFASLMKPMHLPPEHLSPVVAALPSSHASALLRCTQPTAGGVQKSVVQTLASSQFAGVPRQAPRVHVSPTVQTLPSVQGIALKLRNPHAPAPLQAVMVWGVSPSPMKPAGGAVSHVRKVEPTGPASASENALGRSEIGIAPTVTVSLMTPRASAVSVVTPYGWVTV